MDVYNFQGNAIICSNAVATKDSFYKFFKTKFSELRNQNDKPCFLKGTQFWTFTGTHGKSDGKLGNPIGKGIEEHKTTIDKIKIDFNDVISSMEYKFKNPKYIGNPRGKGIAGIDEGSKDEIDDVLELFQEKNHPNVLILAFCFSSTNELKYFMYQHGIYSFATLKNERGEITDGKMFLLDEEQKDFINTIANDKTIKDCVLSGMFCFSFICF